MINWNIYLLIFFSAENLIKALMFSSAALGICLLIPPMESQKMKPNFGSSKARNLVNIRIQISMPRSLDVKSLHSTTPFMTVDNEDTISKQASILSNSKEVSWKCPRWLLNNQKRPIDLDFVWNHPDFFDYLVFKLPTATATATTTNTTTTSTTTSRNRTSAKNFLAQKKFC